MQPTSVSAAAAGEAFAWGCLGDNSLSWRNGKASIRRIVDPGVTYTPPPADVTPAWQRSGSSATEFTLTLGDGQVEAVRSLTLLAEDLRADRPTSSDDPRLEQLESALRELLAIVQRIHEHNWSIGLLQPGNVLISPHAGPSILLPDLGFVWRDDSLLIPDWSKTPFAFLWDLPPAEQQAMLTAQESLRWADVATVARLINWVMTGREQKFVTPPPPDPTLHGHRVRHSATWNSLWDILGRASHAEIETIAELRRLLEAIPLRTLLGMRTLEPKRRRWTAVLAAGCVLLLAGLGGAYFSGLLTGSKKAQDSRTADEQTSRGAASDPGRLAKFRRSLEQWKKEFATAAMPRQAEIVVQVYREAPDPEVGRDETAAMREQILAGWQERCRVAANKISQEQSLDNLRELGTLYRDLIQYQEQMRILPPAPAIEEKERQCLAYIKEQLE